MPALKAYRAGFKPSAQLDRPHAMVGVNVIAAATDAEAQRLFTSVQQAFTNAVRGARRQLQPPVQDIDSYWSPVEKVQASSMLACSFVGSPDTVRRELELFTEQTRADELMVASAIYDHAARLRSYEILAGLK
jgi:alkanesulfonate monooxygenase SsuD/methylene tetrahydromethanopterin reductase-like flavin-dependent oxidoreductase (luciferase family)